MSPRPHHPESEGEMAASSFDQSSENEQERAEAEWLLARESDPDARPPSAELAQEHAELEDLLAHLPHLPSDEGWQDAVLRKAAEQGKESAAGAPVTPSKAPPGAPAPTPWWRRKAVRWASGGGLAAAAAAAVTLRVMTPPAVSLSVDITGASSRGSSTSSKEGAVKDVVHARGKGDLAIFRSVGNQWILVARCPRDPAPQCRQDDDGTLRIDYELAFLGTHEVIMVDDEQLPPDATRNDFLAAAREENIHSIDVR